MVIYETSPNIGGCKIEFLLLHIEIYTAFLIIKDILIIVIYFIHQAHKVLQNVRSFIRNKVCCTCLNYRSACPEMQACRHKMNLLKARYNITSMQFMSLKDKACKYRKKLKKLKETRFKSEKLHMQVLKHLEDTWISELEKMHREYLKLIETKNLLECEFNNLKTCIKVDDVLPENIFDNSEIVDNSEIDFFMEEDINNIPFNNMKVRNENFDALEDVFDEKNCCTCVNGTCTCVECTCLECINSVNPGSSDFKVKICSFVQQSLLCSSSPLSILTTLELTTFSPEFSRNKCILGITLGTLRYINITNNLHNLNFIIETFNKLTLLFAHFTEKFPDQFNIIDEVFNYCSQSNEKLNAYPIIIAAMCKVGIVDTFASSIWFNNCSNTTVLSYSIEILDWIHYEQHGFYCTLLHSQSPNKNEKSLINSCPIIPRLVDLPFLENDPCTYISNHLDSCLLLNQDIPFPAPGSLLPSRQKQDYILFNTISPQTVNTPPPRNKSSHINDNDHHHLEVPLNHSKDYPKKKSSSSPPQSSRPTKTVSFDVDTQIIS